MLMCTAGSGAWSRRDTGRGGFGSGTGSRTTVCTGLTGCVRTGSAVASGVAGMCSSGVARTGVRGLGCGVVSGVAGGGFTAGSEVSGRNTPTVTGRDVGGASATEAGSSSGGSGSLTPSGPAVTSGATDDETSCSITCRAGSSASAAGACGAAGGVARGAPETGGRDVRGTSVAHCELFPVTAPGGRTGSAGRIGWGSNSEAITGRIGGAPASARPSRRSTKLVTAPPAPGSTAAARDSPRAPRPPTSRRRLPARGRRAAADGRRRPAPPTDEW